MTEDTFLLPLTILGIGPGSAEQGVLAELAQMDIFTWSLIKPAPSLPALLISPLLFPSVTPRASQLASTTPASVILQQCTMTVAKPSNPLVGTC